MSLIKHFLTFSSFTALSRFTGFVRDTLCSHFIGKSIWFDTFIIAYKFSNCFRRFFAEGALNVSLVPELVYSRHDTNKAQQIVQNIFSLLLYFLGFFVLIFEVFAPNIMPLFITGYESHILKHVIQLIRINFPYSLLISLCAVCTAILNTRQKFYAEAALPIILNLFLITAIFISREMAQEKITYMMSYGVILAGFIQFIWVYVLCVREGFVLIPKKPILKNETKEVIKKTSKNFLIATVTQINLFVDIYLATWLPAGSISFLFYADRLHQLPLSIIGIALSVVLLPNFAQCINDKEKTAELFYSALIGSIQIIVPVILGLFLLSDVLVYVLFCHGKFQVADSLQTAAVLRGYVLGLPAIILTKIFLSFLFANNISRVPLYGAILAVTTNIIGNLIFMPVYKHYGMAVATSLASWVNFIFLGGYIFKKYEHLFLHLKEISIVLLWNISNIAVILALKKALPIGIQYTHFQNIYSVSIVLLLIIFNYFIVGYYLGFISVPQHIRIAR